MSSLASSPGATVRRRLRVTGVVQGVGFRPFVFRLATSLNLSGHVGNDTDGVFIEVQGPLGPVSAFEARLSSEAPPLARVLRVDSAPLCPIEEDGFRVVASRGGAPVSTLVAPDVAVCDECLGELFDPADRRYRYPFINCTNCGPRFTITVRLPYDRPNTTMSSFVLCPSCSAEYHDPADRRFHAQPVACPDCGPRVRFDSGGPSAPIYGDDALAAAQRALVEGRIVALKGIGGYHLACDATSDRAVAELRSRKHRAAKPLAVMVADLAAARRLVTLGEAEARLLASPERPIVLLQRRWAAPVSPLLAPHDHRLGILLPYSPLHHLLLAPVPATTTAPETSLAATLVMTSGNLSEEPICYDDDEARRRLASIADGWLVHDRAIHVPCDDSVVQLVAGEELPIRRSRGYAPLPVRLPFESPPLLAVGGEMKNTFCLASGQHAWLSQHIGDMGNLETIRAFERSGRQLSGLYGVVPERLVADLHPGYRTRRWAEDHAESAGLEVDLVQHHHAHIAATMAEHQLPLSARVIGFAFDGTGYGTDGAVWGGEVLLGGYASLERALHLSYVPLPGGDSAVRKPYRMALAHLAAAGIEWSADLAPVGVAGPELAAVRSQLDSGLHCSPTSSMGRLFDAVSSLLGVCHVATYEGQAASELQSLAEGCFAQTDYPRLGRRGGTAYSFDLAGGEIDVRPLLASMVADLRHGRPASQVASGFHLAVARLMAAAVERLIEGRRFDALVLTGGVFQNAMLLRLACAELGPYRLPVLTHRLVPPNDGGLALGQAAVAAGRRSTTERSRP